MNWVVLILAVCSGDSCTIVDQEVQVVSDEREADMRKKCDASPDCAEPRRGFFVFRQKADPKKPSKPAAPPPPASSAQVPGTRA